MTVIEFIKEYAVVATAVTAVVTVAGFFLRIYNSAHRKQINYYRQRIRDLEKERAEPQVGVDASDENVAKLTELGRQLDAANELARRLQEQLAAAESRRTTQEEISQGLSADLERARENLDRLGRESKSRNNRVRRALELEGRIWEMPALRSIPKFRPLADRRAPIISALNLKGGVGKTTVTAHLGAALAQRGYRVLLVDLDLQGSLSSMFIPPDLLAQRSKEGKLLQHLLLSAVDQRKTNLLDYVAAVLDGRGGLVAATDRLAYAEMNLSMQWLLRICRNDTRFLLRRALHQKGVTGKYDIVLLDCPPLITTCCVNALAASDYVLVPVLPSRKSAERVPQLLYELRQLCAVINPNLQVMGLVANRTQRTTLTGREQSLWSGLLIQCQDRWGQPIHSFRTVIRQNVEVLESETEFAPLAEGSELRLAFHQLAVELEERLPSDCRRSATAHR